MKVEVQFVDLDHSESMEAFANEKLDKLGRKYDWVIGANVFYKKEQHNNEENYLCEIRLSAPGPQLFAHEYDTNFEKATNQVIKQLDVQLEKRKAKMSDH
ncbi:MAG: ribosome hibernation-promoting factor, HPF/YfiA family [Crocinitomicaceae bacterium]